MATKRVVRYDLPTGWVHDDEDVGCVRWNASRDYLPYPNIGAGGYHGDSNGGHGTRPSSAYRNRDVVHAQPAAGALPDTLASGGDGDTVAVRRLLEEARMIPTGQASMMLTEMRA